ncbi:MAG: hypothetical protein JEY99_08180 [Spirochaetales bacterium]|nr:hypothetical protein [Spirochaetales bacterium]
MEIGKYNTLEVAGKTGKGLVLTDGETQIVLPLKEIPREFDFPENIKNLPDPEKKKKIQERSVSNGFEKQPAENKADGKTAPVIPPGKKGKLVIKTKPVKDEGQKTDDNSEKKKSEAKGPSMKVFVYNSDRETIRATTQTPIAVQGEFARMKVKEVNSFGAFLEWGIPKDLFLPYGAQGKRVKPGEMVWVFIAMDSKKTGIMGFSNLEPFLSQNFNDLRTGQKVTIQIRDFNDNGARVIVDHRYPGLIYEQDFDGPMKIGEVKDAWIRKIRTDGKLDIGLWEKNIDMAEKFKGILLEKLKENDGILSITDKTPPDEIREKLNMSKRQFKMAEGILLREGKIQIHPAGIFLEGVRTPKTLKVKARDWNDLVEPGYDQNAEVEEEKPKGRGQGGRGGNPGRGRGDSGRGGNKDRGNSGYGGRR